jgi:hypothetical protein
MVRSIWPGMNMLDNQVFSSLHVNVQNSILDGASVVVKLFLRTYDPYSMYTQGMCCAFCSA